MKHVVLLVLSSLALLLSPCVAWAQTSAADAGLRAHATLFSVGHRSMLDTYLSPLTYTGPEIRLIREHQRATRLMNGCVDYLNTLQANATYCKTPTEDGKYLSAIASWRFAWHYKWEPVSRFTFQAGPSVAIDGGFVYNTRNGNNPAQGRLSADVALSGMATYAIPTNKRPWLVRYRIDMPLACVFFSPNYGQSYYEIFSLGHTDGNVCVSTPFHAFSILQMLTVDIPLGSHTLRTGYLCDIRQTRPHHLKTHDWTNAFVVGYVKHSNLVKP